MYFYLKLKDKYISKKDYKHAKKLCETFEIKTMEDYHDLYLKSDVLLLADVFENFRDVCINNYKLDPAFYYTALRISMGCMFETNKRKLRNLKRPRYATYGRKRYQMGVFP